MMPTLFCLGLWLAMTVQVCAHDALRDFVRREIELRLRTGEVQLKVVLTFHETTSLKERRKMDQDKDGQISRQEIARYLQRLEPALEDGITAFLSWPDRAESAPLEFSLLYAPKLVLEDRPALIPAHHTVEFILFARIAEAMEEGTMLTVRDGLWPKEKWIAQFELGAGKDALAAEVVRDGSRGQGEARRLEFVVRRGPETVPKP